MTLSKKAEEATDSRAWWTLYLRVPQGALHETRWGMDLETWEEARDTQVSETYDQNAVIDTLAEAFLKKTEGR